MNVHQPLVQIEEVKSFLTPAIGVSVEQALRDANISGADRIEIIDGRIEVTWFKRKANG